MTNIIGRAKSAARQHDRAVAETTMAEFECVIEAASEMAV